MNREPGTVNIQHIQNPGKVFFRADQADIPGAATNQDLFFIPVDIYFFDLFPARQSKVLT